MQRVLEEMCSVVHRRYQKEMLGSPDKVHNPSDYDASNLRPEAEAALIEMCRWFGEGSLPHILEMGSLRVSPGTGKVTVLGDEVVGSGTAFRTEVQVGDIILIEPMVVQKSGDAAAKKTLALSVAVVLSNVRLKIAGFMLAESVAEYVTFVIARGSDTSAPETQAPFSGTTASVPKHMSPRSAQHLFEWDLQTQRRDVVNLRDAEQENLRLQGLKKEADAELAMVLQRPLLIMCVKAWKSQIKPRQKTVSLLWWGWILKNQYDQSVPSCSVWNRQVVTDHCFTPNHPQKQSCSEASVANSWGNLGGSTSKISISRKSWNSWGQGDFRIIFDVWAQGLATRKRRVGFRIPAVFPRRFY